MFHYSSKVIWFKLQKIFKKLKLKTMLEDGETVEFSGKAVVALANDRNILKKTGSTLVAADIGLDYRFCDVDGNFIKIY